jgi:tetratricopeptide (TPR) repeat protein
LGRGRGDACGEPITVHTLRESHQGLRLAVARRGLLVLLCALAPSAAFPQAPGSLRAKEADEPLDRAARTLEVRLGETGAALVHARARLVDLGERARGADLAGSARVVLAVRSEVGPPWVLESGSYEIDGAPVFGQAPGDGDADGPEDVEVFDGRVAPGEHRATVRLVYRTRGRAPEAVSFPVEATFAFPADSGKVTTVRVVAFEKPSTVVGAGPRSRPEVRHGVDSEREELGREVALVPSGATPSGGGPAGVSLAQLEREVRDLEERLGALESGSARSTRESAQARASRRFRQGHERFLAGDWHGAAVLLQDAVDAGGAGGAGDQRTATFELAESLRRQQLCAAALPLYRRLLSRPDAPHAPEALTRAAECGLRLGRHAEVAELLAAARRAWGDVDLPPEALYLAAKSAYRRDDLPLEVRDRRALELLGAVPKPFHVAAGYLRGAVHVRSGDLESASREFIACAGLAATDGRQKEQRELCGLAQARVRAEAEDWSEAAHWYEQVPVASPRHREAQYELAWSLEKGTSPEAALRVAEAFPEPGPPTLLAPEVGVIRGRALAKLQRYSEAGDAYEKVRARYEPMRDQIDAVLVSERDPGRYLDALRPGAGPALALPPPAVDWARASSDAEWARDLAATLESAQGALADARAAADRVDGFLAREGGLRAFPGLAEGHARARALRAAARQLDARLAAQDGSAPLRARLREVEGRAELQERELLERVRSGAEALRIQVSAERRQIDAAAAEVQAAKGRARELLGRQAHASVQAVGSQLHRVVLRADRGVVEMALVRRTDARGQIQSLLHRRAFEDRLPIVPELRRATLERLESRTRALEAEDRVRRQDLIARLEDYVRRHPEDPVYTPEALSRLAELQYEKALEEQGQEVLAAGEAAPPRAPPAPPRGCAAAIDLYGRLASGFPDYKNTDAVYFLLGYCLGEMGRTGEAIQVYGDLVRKFPESRHVLEAWVRIGDLSFEEGSTESLQRAVQAYAKLQHRPDHPLFPHATYMLGWTWYRVDDLPRAVDAFARLLDHHVDVGKRTGRPPGGELWNEGIRYTALSYAEPKWDGVRKAREWFARAGARPWEGAVYMRLGDALFEQTRFLAAIDAYKLLLARDPLSPEAPRAQARIVLAWSRERRPELEAQEREALLATYGESSAWWQKHRGVPELEKEVRQLRETSLASSAAQHHSRARDLQKAGRAEAAVAEYRRAAEGYAEMLRSAPRAKNAPELTYAWADAAYNAGDYKEAAQLYAQVRDDEGSKNQAEAALDAVIAWEAEVERATKAGQIEERPVRLSRDLQGEAPQPVPLPASLLALVRASDAFVGRYPTHARAPAVAYRAGEIYYRYGHREDARRRLDEVATRWPGSDVAKYAANLVVETHLVAKDWAAVEASSARLKAQVGAQNKTLAATLQEFELGGRFQRAVGLMEQQSWGEAAAMFEAVAAAAPRHVFADKALYNAARCREGERRIDDAVALYERIAGEYPESAFADEALFQVAWQADAVYDASRAADRYQLLLQKYPKSKRRKDATFNAARALESLQRHAEAARTFARYVEQYPDAPDAARTQFHAAQLLEKAGDRRGALRVLKEFQRRFAASQEHDLVVQSHLRTGLAEKELGNERAARTAWESAVQEFARRNLDPAGQPVAAAAAAEAQFRLAEADLEAFDRIALPATTHPARLKKALEDKLAEMRKVAPRYQEVKRYLRPDWTLAAFYRQAYLLERLAQTLYDAPVPPEFKRPGQEEYLAVYQDQLAQYARPYEDEAVQVYVQASAAARELHVRNEWTRRIEESLARHRPREYPLFREARGRLLDERAEALVAQRRLEDAEREARRALRADERDAAALVTLATVFQVRGQLELARLALENARQAHAADASVWHRLGFVELALGSRPQALESWRKAAELRPDHVEAHANQGVMLVETGDYPAAVRALEAALRHAPRSAAAWLDLGNAQRGSRRFDEALRAYERALGIDPKLVDALFNLGLLHLDGERDGLPATERLQRAIDWFDRFAAAGGQDPSLAATRAEAQAQLERERKRLAREESDRARKQAEQERREKQETREAQEREERQQKGAEGAVPAEAASPSTPGAAPGTSPGAGMPPAPPAAPEPAPPGAAPPGEGSPPPGTAPVSATAPDPDPPTSTAPPGEGPLGPGAEGRGERGPAEGAASGRVP